MNDWVELREFLRADFEAQLDAAARNDRELRALLAVHRERVLTMLIDQAELATMRQTLASRDGQHEQVDVAATSIIKLNGRKHRAVQ